MVKFLTVHGIGFNFEEEGTFGPFVNDVCKKYGEITNCKFPIGECLTLANWNAKMDEVCEEFNIDSDTIIIAHSLGTLFTPKYLSEHNLRPKAIISIAGGYVAGYNGPASEFFPSAEDMNYCASNIKYRYFIYSDNDRFFNEKLQQNYIDFMKAEPCFYAGYGHMGRTEKVVTVPGLEKILETIHKKENLLKK